MKFNAFADISNVTSFEYYLKNKDLINSVECLLHDAGASWTGRNPQGNKDTNYTHHSIANKAALLQTVKSRLVIPDGCTLSSFTAFLETCDTWYNAYKNNLVSVNTQPSWGIPILDSILIKEIDPIDNMLHFYIYARFTGVLTHTKVHQADLIKSFDLNIDGDVHVALLRNYITKKLPMEESNPWVSFFKEIWDYDQSNLFRFLI